MKTITNKVRGALVVLAAVAACSVASRPAHAQVIFSDNFNANTTSFGTTAVPNWVATDGTFDVIGAGSGFDFYPGNGQYIDLDGTNFNAATFSTTTSFVLGPGTYQLSFLLGKNGTGTESMTVSVGSGFSEVFAGTGAINPFQTVIRTFTVAAGFTAPIVFNHAGGDNQGFIIDNVTLAAVPEPGTMALMVGPAALLLGGMVVRRRRAA